MTPARPLRAQSRTLGWSLGWSLGLPGLAAILGLALPWATPRIERPLANAAAAIAESGAPAGAEPWLMVAARGRDIVAEGEAPDAGARAASIARLAAIPGLRRLIDRVGLVTEASPFVWVATRAREGEVDLTGHRPVEIGPRALSAALAPALPAGARLADHATSARGAPPDFLAAAQYSVSRLAAMRPGATVTLRDTALSITGEPVDPDAYDSLRAAAAHPPEGFTLGEAVILPPVVADFRFEASRSADGGLALAGNVVSETARAALRAEAAQVADGGAVDDRMRTARGLPAAIDPAAVTALALKVAGLMQDGGVTLAGSTLSVAGVAIDPQAAPEIEGLIRDGRPAGVQAGTVTVTTRPLTPYKTVIRRDSDSVTVSGHLPDQAARDRIAAALRPRFFQERIVDRSRLAEGAAPSLSAALEAMIDPLSTLSRGEIVATGQSVRLSGESLYRESARRLQEAAPRQAPAGWSATAAITGPKSPPRRDPSYCRVLFDQAVEGAGLRFAPGSAALKPDFYPLLDAIAALSETCPALAVEIVGHDDPAGPAREPKPAIDTPMVDSTASLDPVKRQDAPAGKPADSKTNPIDSKTKSADLKAKPAQAKPAQIKPAQGKTTDEAAASPKPEPVPDLPRQRALAIVGYLLKAGMSADRVVAAAAKPRPEREGIGFALRS